MANTPDKTGSDKPAPKPLDIMSRNIWALEPGYHKAPLETAADAVKKMVAETKAPTQGQPPAQQAGEKESPVTQEAAADQPDQSQPEASRAAAPDEPARPLAKMTPSFAVAANLPFHILTRTAYAAPSREAPDPHAEREERLIADAKDPATTANTFSAQRIAANSALAASKNHNNDRDEAKDEEKERRDRFLDLMLTNPLYASLYECVSTDLENIKADIGAVDAQIAQRRETSFALQMQIDGAKAEMTQIRAEMQGLAKESAELRQKRDNAATAYTQAENDYKEALKTSNPEQEAALKQQAMEQNKDVVRKAYEEAGLRAEFDVLQRAQQGDKTITPREIESANDKILAKNMTADPEAAVVKYLQKTNPDHPYLQTAEAKKIIMDQARLDLGHAQYDYAQKREDMTDRRIAFLNTRLESLDQKIKTLQEAKDKNDEELRKLIKAREHLAKMQERAQEYKNKLDDPAFQERLRKGDPEAQKELERLDKEYRAQSYGQRFGQRRWWENQQTAQSGAPAADTSASSPPRTTTDSAAGLVGGSALAQADGSAKGAFNRAAPNATPAAAPEPDATLIASADQQQKRQQFTATGLNA
ncbi:MAG: hypothetical protein HYU57_02250 [Micavibrio aeruginosavorus]|nr:hypothetical protein [Micavibrio aeruginosavorus]